MEHNLLLAYQDIFDRYADEYDRWFNEHQDTYFDELRRIKQSVGTFLEPALEIGVGSGRFAEMLGISHGIDPSRSLGIMAKERGIQVIQGVGEHLPVKSNTYQAVFLITVLCFLKDPEKVLSEVHRVVMQNGILAVAFIEQGGTIAQTFLNSPKKGRFLTHATFYVRDEIVRMVNKSGFVQLSSDCTSGFCIQLYQRTEF